MEDTFISSVVSRAVAELKAKATEELSEEVGRMQRAQGEATANRDEALKAVSQASQQKRVLDGEIAEARKVKAGLAKEIESLTQERASLDSALAEARKLLSEQLDVAQKTESNAKDHIRQIMRLVGKDAS